MTQSSFFMAMKPLMPYLAAVGDKQNDRAVPFVGLLVPVPVPELVPALSSIVPTPAPALV